MEMHDYKIGIAVGDVLIVSVDRDDTGSLRISTFQYHVDDMADADAVVRLNAARPLYRVDDLHDFGFGDVE